MKTTARTVAATLALAISLPCQPQAKVQYLKEEPPKGALGYRQVVYVDDGTCPNGEVRRSRFHAKFAASRRPALIILDAV
jgi:hypothetical protein